MCSPPDNGMPLYTCSPFLFHSRCKWPRYSHVHFHIHQWMLVGPHCPQGRLP